MVFFVARSGRIGCPDNCAAWISAEGMIDENTANDFRIFLKKLGSRKLPVVIHSGGGSVRSALAIGRMIRERGLDVVVARTETRGCSGGRTLCGTIADTEVRGDPTGAGAFCASACVFILAAGNRRLTEPGAVVGVHQILSTRTIVSRFQTFRTTMGMGDRAMPRRELVSEQVSTRTEKHAEARAGANALVGTYLREMAASPLIISLMDTAPPSSIRVLWQTELQSIGLVTERYPITDLLSGSPSREREPAASSLWMPLRGIVGRNVEIAGDLVERPGEPGITLIAVPATGPKSIAASFRPGLRASLAISPPDQRKADAGSLTGPVMLALPRKEVCGLRRSYGFSLNFGGVIRGSRIISLPFALDSSRFFATRQFFDNACAPTG